MITVWRHEKKITAEDLRNLRTIWEVDQRWLKVAIQWRIIGHCFRNRTVLSYCKKLSNQVWSYLSQSNRVWIFFSRMIGYKLPAKVLWPRRVLSGCPKQRTMGLPYIDYAVYEESLQRFPLLSQTEEILQCKASLTGTTLLHWKRQAHIIDHTANPTFHKGQDTDLSHPNEHLGLFHTSGQGEVTLGSRFLPFWCPPPPAICSHAHTFKARVRHSYVTA